MSMILRLLFGICWFFLHLFVSILHIGSDLIHRLTYCLISAGLLRKYQNIKMETLRYLAIVIDTEEATDTRRIKQLLHWFSALGIKYVVMYDMEGVLKKTIDSGTCFFDGDTKDGSMTVEVLSLSDNKEAIAKAASFLCHKHLTYESFPSNMKEPVFTEADVDNALKAVGCSGPEPDLLLIYGPARCHLGFPAWRMRYTEIVHMGRLRHMQYGAVVKAIYDFSMKHQNYGT